MARKEISDGELQVLARSFTALQRFQSKFNGDRSDKTLAIFRQAAEFYVEAGAVSDFHLHTANPNEIVFGATHQIVYNRKSKTWRAKDGVECGTRMRGVIQKFNLIETSTVRIQIDVTYEGRHPNLDELTKILTEHPDMWELLSPDDVRHEDHTVSVRLLSEHNFKGWKIKYGDAITKLEKGTKILRIGRYTGECWFGEINETTADFTFKIDVIENDRGFVLDAGMISDALTMLENIQSKDSSRPGQYVQI